MDLTEAQWEKVKPLLAAKRRSDGRGRPWRDARAVLNGVLWILRTGAPWHDLPDRYPPYQTCHRRFQQWQRDGTLIAVEFAGAGPSLVLVHGGIGDHSRWQPLFPQFTPRFTLFAMDRRGHGASGDSPNYSLQKEAEDIAAVVNSCPGKVFLLAHSYGATCALEAAFLTPNIAKLVLYEPPIQVEQKFIDRVIVTELEKLIRNGEREQALVLFMRDIVKIPPQEIAAAKARPSWATQVADIHSSVREIRATDGYTFDASRMRELTVPTLLLTGSDTAAHHKRAIAALAGSLPSRKVFVFEGQGHNAMDTVP